MLSSHNDYYPLKVFLEHAVGEGMVLDVFKDLLLETLPDSDPRVPAIKKKLRVVCNDEAEHVAGAKSSAHPEAEPWLRTPFLGARLELALPRSWSARCGNRVRTRCCRMDGFVAHVRDRAIGKERSATTAERPSGKAPRDRRRPRAVR
jgi:hypothetical protein